SEQFPGHTVKPTVYALRTASTRYRENADAGGFEIHGPADSHVATVDATGGVWGFGIGKQPLILVLKGNEALGKALAKAFKEHAGFRISPKVLSADHVYTANEYFDADARKVRQIKEEAKKLRQ
ncbi:MAG: hypothetical protein V1817_02030, partial [Candidatus Micrarchaeota archaeon]